LPPAERSRIRSRCRVEVYFSPSPTILRPWSRHSAHCC